MEETVKNEPQDSNQYAQAPSEPSAKGKRVQDLFSWKSLSRPAWQYGRDAYSALAAVAFLLSIISAFFQQWFVIVVIWAAFFLFYQLSKYPPAEVEHKITTEGIVSIERTYLWGELGPFWFTHKGEDTLLHIAHNDIFGQIVLLINKADQEKMRDILAEYLPFVEIPGKSAAEKMADWFGKKFPIEKVVTRNFKAPEGPQNPA